MNHYVFFGGGDMKYAGCGFLGEWTVLMNLGIRRYIMGWVGVEEGIDIREI